MKAVDMEKYLLTLVGEEANISNKCKALNKDQCLVRI